MNEQKQIEEMNDILKRIFGSSFAYKIEYGKYGGYEGHKEVYTRDIAEKLYTTGYRKRNEWISVKDELPDKSKYDWVLVNIMFNEDGTYGVPTVAEYRNGEWWDSENKISELFETVTHWMPLPTPPTEKGE